MKSISSIPAGNAEISQVDSYLEVMTYSRCIGFQAEKKARLSLLRLMLSGLIPLIFDRQTNRDIESKGNCRAAIMEFKRTVLIVSRDRYLLQ